MNRKQYFLSWWKLFGILYFNSSTLHPKTNHSRTFVEDLLTKTYWISVSHLHTRIEEFSFGQFQHTRIYFSISNNLLNTNDSSRVSVRMVFIPIGTKMYLHWNGIFLSSRFKFKIAATLKRLVFNGDDFKYSTYFVTKHFLMKCLSQRIYSKLFQMI